MSKSKNQKSDTEILSKSKGLLVTGALDMEFILSGRKIITAGKIIITSEFRQERQKYMMPLYRRALLSGPDVPGLPSCQEQVLQFLRSE